MQSTVARLAGILAILDDLQTITVGKRHIEAAIILSQYYLSEGLRLFNMSHDNPDLILAEKLLAWAQTLGDKPVYLQLVYQCGPNPIRDKETAMRIIRILEDHGWFLPIEGGATIDGSHRRKAWKVVK